MNLWTFKPYSLMFYSTLLLGILVSLTSNNWLSIWMGLELNMYSFIPLLLQSNFNQEKEAAIKYFIVQALASGLLLTASLFVNFSISWLLLILSLMIKLGLAPCHFWFPTVMSSLSWNMCWLLTTLQKIAPLFLFSQIMFLSNTMFISTISMISALTGGIGGLKQTQLRPLLAYSSIGHLGWLSSAILTSFSIFNVYFLSYLFMISAIMYLMNKNNMNSINPSTLNQNSKKLFLALTLLSLGGLPPLFGFFPKLLILFILVQNNFILLSLILIIASTINLYYYLKIVLLSSLQLPSFYPFYYFKISPYSLFFSFTFSISTVLGLFLFSICI